MLSNKIEKIKMTTNFNKYIIGIIPTLNTKFILQKLILFY